MTRRKKPETLNELMAEMERSEKQLHYWEDQEKILRHQISELTRSERTNRLCIRAGIRYGMRLRKLKNSGTRSLPAALFLRSR